MKKIFCVVLFLPSLLFAQVGQWTWMKGSNGVNKNGIYGTLGVEGPLNAPGSRYEAGSMRDAQNNFWLFGGSGYDHNNINPGFLDDLWKYNPVTNNWTFMKGDSVATIPGVYGTQGVSSPTNKPGGRFAFVTWSDEVNGALWLFGGAGGGNTNDLWKYDIASNEWTWMSGSNVSNASGVYGTKGVASAGNVPGARNEVTTSWIDSNGNLWLFGGGGNDASGTYGDLNDLWMYDTGTNQWTWVSGDNFVSAAGIYGTKGVAAPGNKPGGRHPYNSWKDKQGNFWIFGGIIGTSLYYNDLWKFDITSKQWTWMNGSNVGATAPTSGWHIGTPCTGDALNTPGRRYENKANWTDTCGNFWSYGGFTPEGDLWTYNPAMNQWMWVSGDSATLGTAIYGTQGTPNALNKPGARYGAPSWKHSDGSFWMFGGPDGTGGRHNDLWRYVMDPACSFCVSILPPAVSFQASDTVPCANDCISFTDLSTNATSWKWTFSGGLPPTSTDENPSFVCYDSSGKFNVTLTAYNAGGSDSLTMTNYIKVQSAPPLPHIKQNVNELYFNTDSTYSSYQWYDSTVLIPGATDTFLVITHGGNYNVYVTNKAGCKIAVGINVVLGIDQPADDKLQFVPNPVHNGLMIKGYQLTGKSILNIYNLLGEVILSRTLSSNEVIDVSALPAGIYFLRLARDKEIHVGKFVKE